MGCNHLFTFLGHSYSAHYVANKDEYISWPAVAATAAGTETGAYGLSGSPDRAGFYPFGPRGGPASRKHSQPAKSHPLFEGLVNV